MKRLSKTEVQVKWFDRKGEMLFECFVYVYKPQNAVVVAVEQLDHIGYNLVKDAVEVHTQVTPPQR